MKWHLALASLLLAILGAGCDSLSKSIYGMPRAATGEFIMDDSGEGYVRLLVGSKISFGPNYARRISTAVNKVNFQFRTLYLDGQFISLLASGTDGQEHFVQHYFSGVSLPEVRNVDQALEFMRTNLRYRKDLDTFGREDVWQTSSETLARGEGDCEDHAILLADILRGLGYDVRTVWGEINGEGHVWVLLILGPDDMRLIEATEKDSSKFMRLPRPAERLAYVPTWVFNQRYLYSRLEGQGGEFPDHWRPASEYIAP